MRALKILHAADLHLDSPFEALPEEKAALRRAEQRQLLGKIAALSESEGADLLLLAGDLLDTGSAYSETARTLSEVLGGIGIPVFLAPGNHDFYTAHSPYARPELSRNIHIFKENKLSCTELPELGVRIWGAAFTDSRSRPLLRGITLEKQPDTLDIAVLHGVVGASESPYNPISEQEIAESGFDYIALGHVHACSGLRRAGNTFYAWPGCAEGRGFDETGEKGVLSVRVQSGEAYARFLPLGGRRYEILSVDIGGEAEPLPVIESALPDDAKCHVFRVVLTGERGEAPNLQALYTDLEGRCFRLQLRDRTSIRRDVWEKADEDTLRGLFLAKLRAKYDAAAPEEREKIVRAARWGIQAFENGEELG